MARGSRPASPPARAVVVPQSGDPDVRRALSELAAAVVEEQRDPKLPRSGSVGDTFHRDSDGRIVALEIGAASHVLTVVDGLPAWAATSGGGGGVTDGDKGDITVSGGGLVWTIDAAALAGYALATRTISTTAPLAGGGDLSADRTLTVATFGAAASGVVPASGGGAVNFLRADGAWAAPAGGSGGSVDDMLALGCL